MFIEKLSIETSQVSFKVFSPKYKEYHKKDINYTRGKKVKFFMTIDICILFWQCE